MLGAKKVKSFAIVRLPFITAVLPFDLKNRYDLLLLLFILLSFKTTLGYCLLYAETLTLQEVYK